MRADSRLNRRRYPPPTNRPEYKSRPHCEFRGGTSPKEAKTTTSTHHNTPHYVCLANRRSNLLDLPGPLCPSLKKLVETWIANRCCESSLVHRRHVHRIQRPGHSKDRPDPSAIEPLIPATRIAQLPPPPPHIYIYALSISSLFPIYSSF